jgi:hypothetical protein
MHFLFFCAGIGLLLHQQDAVNQRKRTTLYFNDNLFLYDNLCLTLLNFGRIDEDRLEAWIELVILRHLTGRDDEEIQQQPAGSSTTMVVRSDTEEEENCPQCRKFFREIRPSGWNIFPSKT